jgi:hypothetical protein
MSHRQQMNNVCEKGTMLNRAFICDLLAMYVSWKNCCWKFYTNYPTSTVRCKGIYRIVKHFKWHVQQRTKENTKIACFNWTETGQYWSSNGNKHQEILVPTGSSKCIVKILDSKFPMDTGFLCTKPPLIAAMFRDMIRDTQYITIHE